MLVSELSTTPEGISHAEAMRRSSTTPGGRMNLGIIVVVSAVWLATVLAIVAVIVREVRNDDRYRRTR